MAKAKSKTALARAKQGRARKPAKANTAAKAVKRAKTPKARAKTAKLKTAKLKSTKSAAAKAKSRKPAAAKVRHDQDQGASGQSQICQDHQQIEDRESQGAEIGGQDAGNGARHGQGREVRHQG